MNCYLDNHYGADADGNRSIPMWFYQLEPQDDEQVLDQLKDLLTEFDPIVEGIPETVELQFINPITEDDISIDVTTEPYLDELRVHKIVNNENYEKVIENLLRFDKQTAIKLQTLLNQKLGESKMNQLDIKRPVFTDDDEEHY